MTREDLIDEMAVLQACGLRDLLDSQPPDTHVAILARHTKALYTQWPDEKLLLEADNLGFETVSLYGQPSPATTTVKE